MKRFKYKYLLMSIQQNMHRLLYLVSFIIIVFLIFNLYYRVWMNRTTNTKKDPIPATSSIFLSSLLSSSSPVIETLPEESMGSIMRRQVESVDKLNKMSLKDLVVKSSFNSAYNGKEVDIQAIHDNLQNGFRLLDFEIYADNNKNPVIAYNSDKSVYLFNKRETNTLMIKDVFHAITKYGFGAPSPNAVEPLFLNLRVYVTDTSEYEIYTKLAQHIDTYLSSYMYLDKNRVALPVTKDTIIEKIQRKLIIIIDITILPPAYSRDDKLQSYEELIDSCDIKGMTSKNCEDYFRNAPGYCKLRRWTNIHGGKQNLQIYTIHDLLRMQPQPVNINDKKGTDTTILKMVYPNEIYNEHENYLQEKLLLNIVKNYGVQFLLFSTYKKNPTLDDMAEFYSKRIGGIVTIEYIIKYYRTET